MQVIKEITKRAPAFEPRVIFDVGANKGDVTMAFSRLFPGATIHAFEPAVSTFEMLSRKSEGNPNVKTHNLAFDVRPGVGKFTNVPGSTGNKLTSAGAEETVSVEVVTGDAFCNSAGIGHIDFLKIDTEGYDLRVLSGFSGMLGARKITYIQVECATSLDNRFHVHLERFIHYLHPYGYRLFGLYDFVRICYRTKQQLNGVWFCNAVFVAEVEDPKLRRDGMN